MSWGNGTCFLGKLQPNMIELDGPIQILDLPNFMEGPWLHKHNGLYYLTYASSGDEREMMHYATATDMEGTWTYRGALTGMAENSFTIHPGIIEYKGNWYLFYHNAKLTLKSRALSDAGLYVWTICIINLMGLWLTLNRQKKVLPFSPSLPKK